MFRHYETIMRVNDYHRIYSIVVDAQRQSMEPKIIKEEAIERDSNTVDEPILNNNNNKESAFRIHTRKSKIKPKDAGFSSTTTSDSSGEHLLSPTHPLPVQVDVESERSSPTTDTFRNHSKLKRFLTTLVQFSGQISPQTSERVKGQIFTLVNNVISIEEFHHNIQEMTNFPLRPFVLPFLRSHLSLLQRDLQVMARNNKQTLSQYLKQHENAYLDRDSQLSEPSEIFHQLERIPPPPSSMSRDNINNNNNNNNSSSSSSSNNNNNNNGISNKRPYSLAAAASNNYYETAAAYATDLDYQQPCVKRPNLGYTMPFMYHHPHLQPQEPPPPPHPYNILPLLHIRETEEHKGHVEDEWKNIHVMLNCILSMVEKTKKALGILQERGLTDANFPDWNKKKTTEEILAQTVRQTEERIENIKKKAEDSMNEIRHQAMIELQKLVLAAENKMIELITAERTKTNDNRTSGASLQISPTLISQYNSCWNCGRKAHETCSGCNTAQYCSSFCQHKDWESHHQTCCVHSVTTVAPAVHVQHHQQAAAASTPPTGKKLQPPSVAAANVIGSSSSTVVADDLSVNRAQSTTAVSSLNKITGAPTDGSAVNEFSAAEKQSGHGGNFNKQSSTSLACTTTSSATTTTTTTTTTLSTPNGAGKQQ